MRSRSFINGVATETAKGSQILFLVFRSVGNLLTMSRGRDKLLGLIQQICDLYKQCMIEYIKAYRVNEWPISMQKAQSLYSSIKNARKFIRLLRWVEEMGQVGEKLTYDISKVLCIKIIRHLIGICYFFMDNILWIYHIGIKADWVDIHFLERVKDIMSIIRYLLNVVVFLLTAHEKSSLENKLRLSLYKSEAIITPNEYHQNVLIKLINARSKRRFQAFEMIIIILRVLMLAKSLKLPGSRYISNIFYCTCGCISSTFSLFKLLITNKTQ
ncbi:hypothetical protein SteCoe_37905 [Stentor coeruleus]|uniref:Uncharacterized protein n=1 Tax=Stentor coeruleus TaxID=5963 RepID=A0A1R2AKU8_9CILI|nr:hypothetical protein SteCoe_39055 [Stentor coeruleus]OMJ65612.1 hypothetical protein SteCoe_37905 [Stentor coeruleus]